MRRALALCTDTLLPTLFPFLVLSELMISCHAGDTVGKLLQRPAGFLFGVSGAGTTALLMGLLCGFPVGTAVAVSLYDRGEITHGELKRLFLFVNNPSPGFLICAVGGEMLGSARTGLALWGIVWGSALFIGILLRIWGGDLCKKHHIPANGTRKPLSFSDLTGAVSKGFHTLFQVFAFVLFFSCVTACLSPALRALPLSREAEALLSGIPEMTAGIAQAASATPASTALPIVAFLAGFSGLSVCLQLFSVGEGRGLRPLPYLGIKLVQGGLCSLLTVLYLRLFPPSPPPTGAISAFSESRVRQCSLLAVLGITLFAPLLRVIVQKFNKRERL
jgi:sporulation integral membrane protein YlbJ